MSTDEEPPSAEHSARSAILHDPDRVRRLSWLNHGEFLRELARWSGPLGDIQERDGVLLYATGTEFPVTCNGALRTSDDLDDEVVLDRAETWFGARGRGYTLHLQEPDTADSALIAAAEDRGFVSVGHSPAMVCGSRLHDAPCPDGVELRWVAEHDSPGTALTDFVSVSDQAYQSLGMPAGAISDLCVDPDRLLEPHLQTVLAYEGGRAVAAAQLLLSHGVGGVYYVGTLADVRGRGLGDLVTRAVTNRGFDLGAAFTLLQATSMGESVYRRMGYEQIASYRRLVRFV